MVHKVQEPEDAALDFASDPECHPALRKSHRSDYRIVSSHSSLTRGYLEAVQRSKWRTLSRIEPPATRLGSQATLSISLYALHVLGALLNLFPA